MAEQTPDDFADLLSLTDDDDETSVAPETEAEPVDDLSPDFLDEPDIFADLDVDESETPPVAVVEPPAPVKKTRAKRTPKAVVTEALVDTTAVEAAARMARSEIAAAQQSTDPRDVEIAALKAQLAAQVPVDPRDAEIAALKAELSRPVQKFEDEDDVDKTNERKALQDKVARRNAEVMENSPALLIHADGPGEKVLIHFEVDGFMAFGQSWYRGQEMEFIVDGPVYNRTKDINGNSWVDLRNDRYAQIERWGKVFFEEGSFRPRPGEEFSDDLVAQDAKRRRAVPIVSNR